MTWQEASRAPIKAFPARLLVLSRSPKTHPRTIPYNSSARQRGLWQRQQGQRSPWGAGRRPRWGQRGLRSKGSTLVRQCHPAHCRRPPLGAVRRAQGNFFPCRWLGAVARPPGRFCVVAAGVLCLRGALTRGGSGAGAGRLERGVRSSLTGERRSQETSIFVRGRASARVDRELAAWYVYASYPTGSSSSYNSRGHPHKGTKTHSKEPGCRSVPYIDPFWPSLGPLGTSQSANRAGQRLRNRPSQPKVERTQ